MTEFREIVLSEQAVEFNRSLMKYTPVIIVLPVGEFEADFVHNRFEAIIAALQSLDADLLICEPVSDEAAARRSIQSLSEKNADLLVIIPLRGLSAQTIEAACLASQARCLIWPIQGGYALPSSALAVGALREAGAPVELLYAPAEDQASIEKFRCLTLAALACTRLQKSRIGVIGGLFHNLISCRYDPRTITVRLGTTILSIPYDELRAAIRSTSHLHQEIELLTQAITPLDALSAAEKSTLEAGIKLHLALKRIAQQNKLDGFAIECWTGLPREIGLNPCLGFIEDAYTLACEGDVLMCLSLLTARYLSETSAFAGDLYDLDLDGNLTLVHCGAPASLAPSKNEVILGKSLMAQERGFETITCRPRLDPGPVSIFRLYGSEGDKLHLAFGELVSYEQSPNMTARIKLNGDRWDFLEHCFGNHYVVVAGDIRKELKLLGRWLGITVFDT